MDLWSLLWTLKVSSRLWAYAWTVISVEIFAVVINRVSSCDMDEMAVASGSRKQVMVAGDDDDDGRDAWQTVQRKKRNRNSTGWTFSTNVTYGTTYKKSARMILKNCQPTINSFRSMTWCVVSVQWMPGLLIYSRTCKPCLPEMLTLTRELRSWSTKQST